MSAQRNGRCGVSTEILAAIPIAIALLQFIVRYVLNVFQLTHWWWHPPRRYSNVSGGETYFKKSKPLNVNVKRLVRFHF